MPTSYGVQDQWGGNGVQGYNAVGLGVENLASAIVVQPNPQFLLTSQIVLYPTSATTAADREKSFVF